MGRGDRGPENDGFATADLSGITLRARPAKVEVELEGDKYPGIYKETPKQAPRPREVATKILPGIIFGRQLDYRSPKNGWQKFVDSSAQSSGQAIEALPPRELYVPYLTGNAPDKLMRAYVTRHDNPRMTQKDLDRQFYRDVEIVQGIFRQEAHLERDFFDDLHSTGNGYDFERSVAKNNYIKRSEERGYGAWQPAIFTVSSHQITEAPNGLISVGVQDPEMLLKSARDRAIDILCGVLRLDANMATDTSKPVTSESDESESVWRPRLGILQNTARHSAKTGLRLAPMPMDLPLMSPSISIAS